MLLCYEHRLPIGLLPTITGEATFYFPLSNAAVAYCEAAGIQLICALRDFHRLPV
jgi:hypothetical protein